jgi:hypothetical protein
VRPYPWTSHPLSQQPPPPPPNSQQRDADLIRTWPELRAHLGYRLDLFGLDRRPPVQARYLAPALLWIVYAVAWTEPGAPFAVWASRLDRPCHLVYDFDGAAPSADAVAALGRMADLIIGRGRRRGRRSYAEDTTWRTIAEDAEARYAARPGQGWRPIAAVLGVDLRTLSRYRALLAREATSAVRPVPTLLSGGLGG